MSLSAVEKERARLLSLCSPAVETDTESGSADAPVETDTDEFSAAWLIVFEIKAQNISKHVVPVFVLTVPLVIAFELDYSLPTCSMFLSGPNADRRPIILYIIWCRNDFFVSSTSRLSHCIALYTWTILNLGVLFAYPVRREMRIIVGWVVQPGWSW